MAAATTIAAIGVGTQLASAGMSFGQAAKQKKEQKKAEADAKRYMDEARKKLGMNFFDALSIQKEPYELQREALLSQGATATQAAREGEQRGVATTAGQIQAAQNAEQSGVRSAMGAEMLALDKMSAEQDQQNIASLAQLDIGSGVGAQQAAADAQRQSAQSLMGGFEGLTSAAGAGLEMIPLYQKGKQGKMVEDLMGMINNNQVDRSLITNQLKLAPNAGDQVIQNALLSLTPDQIDALNFSESISGAGMAAAGGLTGGLTGGTLPTRGPVYSNPFDINYSSIRSGS